MASKMTTLGLTQLTATNGRNTYNIDSLDIKIGVGGEMSCSFIVIGKLINEWDITPFEELDLNSEFKYSDKVVIQTAVQEVVLKDRREAKSTQSVDLFCGYVINTGTGIMSSPESLEYQSTVTLQGIADLYKNENVPQATFLTNDNGILPGATYSQFMSNIAKANLLRGSAKDGWIVSMKNFCVALLDDTAVPVNHSWVRGESAIPHIKLADIVAKDPDRSLKLPVTDYDGFMKSVFVSCTSNFGKKSGLDTLNEILHSFFLIAVPLIDNGMVTYKPNIGISTELSDLKLNTDNILGIQYYPAQARYSKFTTMAVYIPGYGSKVQSVVSLGHDSGGNPKVQVLNGSEIDSRVSEEYQGNAKFIPFGAVQQLAIPSWAVYRIVKEQKAQTKEEQTTNGELKDPTKQKELRQFGVTMAKAAIATNGGFSGKLVAMFNPDPKLYRDLVQHLGEEHKLQYQNGSRYGRLLNVHYTIKFDNATLAVNLKATFDCIVNEAEYNAFKISPEELGFEK